MLEFLRRIMTMNNTPRELTSFYGLSAPPSEVLRKREREVKRLTAKMGDKHRLALSVRK